MNAHLPARRLLVGMAAMVLLAGCGAGATVAPSSTTPAPASTAPVATAPLSPTASPTPAAVAKTTSVAGTATCPTGLVGYSSTGSDGLQHFRGGTLTCTVTTDDPRVSGTETGSPWNRDTWGKTDSVATVQWGTTRLENAGGAWEGTGSGVYSSDRGDIVVSWYKGTGGYAGLGYFELRTGKTPMAIRGLIFPGDPPNLAGLPPVTGPAPSPNVPATPTPVPSPTRKAIAYGPVSVVQGTSEYTFVDIVGNTFAGNETVNNPRVSGAFLAPSWTLNFWGATGDSPGSGTQSGPSRLENAGGTWEGVGSGIYDNSDVIAIWYKGSGSYAGLSYFELVARSDLFGPTAGGIVTGVFGQVFPGDPPTP
jgi:hypothetical protein